MGSITMLYEHPVWPPGVRLYTDAEERAILRLTREAEAVADREARPYVGLSGTKDALGNPIMGKHMRVWNAAFHRTMDDIKRRAGLVSTQERSLAP